MDGFKYGLLIFSDLPHALDRQARRPPEAVRKVITVDPRTGITDEDVALNGTETVEVAPDARTFTAKLDSLFREKEIKHWRDWIGTTQWDSLVRKQRMVIVRIPSAHAEVDDSENVALANRLNLIRHAALLAGPNGLVWGKTWSLTGEAYGLTPVDPLKSIRNFQHARTIIHPYYCERDSFLELQPPGDEDGWFGRWCEAVALVERAAQGGFPRLLFFGLMAFQRAFEPREIEFKIPDCVRAAECILGLPRSGGGRNTFADRVLALVPEVSSNWYVGGADVRDRLIKLYEHRNDCVHGKVPFLSLQTTGVDGPEEAARFDYMAELVARSALIKALRNPRMREIFDSREALEQEWAEKRFP